MFGYHFCDVQVAGGYFTEKFSNNGQTWLNIFLF